MSIIISTIISGILLFYFDYKAKKRIRKNLNGKFVLKVDVTGKWLGIICCLIGVFLLNMMLLYGNKDIYLFASLTTGLFLFLGSITLMWFYNYELIFDNEKLIVTNWLNNKKVVLWKEIKRIKYLKMYRLLKFYTESIEISVTQDSEGFIEIIKMIESKNLEIKNKELIPLREDNRW
ncbi:MAG: hypothetical protein ACPF88_05520 [Flavobacteriaceae bacterium]